jgi:hypothetical protein
MVAWYRGHGAWVPIIPGLLCIAAAVALQDAKGPAKPPPQWSVGLCLLLSGLILYPWGRKVNGRIDAAEETMRKVGHTGPDLPRHSFCDYNMEHWGIILGLIGLVLAVGALIKPFW